MSEPDYVPRTGSIDNAAKLDGLSKILEEIGEGGQELTSLLILHHMARVQQVAGKLIAFPDGHHPDGAGDLFERIMKELADLRAGIDYFVANEDRISDKLFRARYAQKLHTFMQWGAEEGARYAKMERERAQA